MLRLETTSFLDNPSWWQDISSENFDELAITRINEIIKLDCSLHFRIVKLNDNGKIIDYYSEQDISNYRDARMRENIQMIKQVFNEVKNSFFPPKPSLMDVLKN